MGTRIVLLALALMLLRAAGAAAEPDRSATLDGANPKLTWESSGTGVLDPTGFVMPPAFRCTGAPFSCEYILLEVKAAGELTLTLDSTAGLQTTDPTGVACGDAPCPGVQELDGYLYKSTAGGEPMSGPLTRECATIYTSETCKVAVKPGLYVIEVEFFLAAEAPYIGTAELVVDPSAPPVPPSAETITLDGCKFTLYYFKDSAERLQAHVPAGYRLRPYPGAMTEGTATIAAAAYDCDGVELPGSPPARSTFTVLSVLVYPPGGTAESPAMADFYVLWVHANNPQLVDLLAARGMPAHHVPGMRFQRPLLSVAVRVNVPWTVSPFQLAMTGYHQDMFHPHENTYSHVAADGRLVEMDFLTHQVRDQFCYETSDHPHPECGKLTAQAGTPIASFFGASKRTAANAWDHDPIKRSWFVLRGSQEGSGG